MKKTLLIAMTALCLLGLMGCKKTYKPKTVTVNNKETIEKYSAYKMQKVEKYGKNGSLKSEKGFLGNLSTKKNNEIIPLYESNKYSVKMDSQGPLVKKLQTKREFFYENKYDSKNNLVYQKTTDEQGIVICEDYYEYEENKLIKHKSFGGTKNILYEEGINNIKDYSFLYSIGGIPFDPLDPDTHCWLEETFEYGKNNNLSSRTIEIGAYNGIYTEIDDYKGFYARLSASMTETYSYKYNSDGSLAEKRTDINILGVYPGTQINRSFFRKTAD